MKILPTNLITNPFHFNIFICLKFNLYFFIHTHIRAVESKKPNKEKKLRKIGRKRIYNL